VRAICDRARTQRAALKAAIAQIGQFLSLAIYLGPPEHRLPFACDSEIEDLPNIYTTAAYRLRFGGEDDELHDSQRECARQQPV
jgi:hypothetical protein